MEEDNCIHTQIDNPIYNDPTKIPYIRPSIKTSCGQSISILFYQYSVRGINHDICAWCGKKIKKESD